MKRILLATIAASLFTLPALAADKKIERLWKAKCSACHGMDGKGQTEKGKKMQVADMTTADYQKKFSDDDLKKAINEGVKKEEGGVKKEMDAYKDEIKGEQLDGIIAHIRGLAAK